MDNFVCWLINKSCVQLASVNITCNFLRLAKFTVTNIKPSNETQKKLYGSFLNVYKYKWFQFCIYIK